MAWEMGHVYLLSIKKSAYNIAYFGTNLKHCVDMERNMYIHSHIPSDSLKNGQV